MIVNMEIAVKNEDIKKFIERGLAEYSSVLNAVKENYRKSIKLFIEKNIV